MEKKAIVRLTLGHRGLLILCPFPSLLSTLSVTAVPWTMTATTYPPLLLRLLLTVAVRLCTTTAAIVLYLNAETCFGVLSALVVVVAPAAVKGSVFRLAPWWARAVVPVAAAAVVQQQQQQQVEVVVQPHCSIH